MYHQKRKAQKLAIKIKNLEIKQTHIKRKIAYLERLKSANCEI